MNARRLPALRPMTRAKILRTHRGMRRSTRPARAGFIPLCVFARPPSEVRREVAPPTFFRCVRRRRRTPAGRLVRRAGGGAVSAAARREDGTVARRPAARLAALRVERATPNQITRVRGEWARLAIGHVRRRLPQAREPDLVQARRRLRRALDSGERAPRLRATRGRCASDAGNEAVGREFLEPATAAGVVRPRAFSELAGLRFATLRRAAPETARFC